MVVVLVEIARAPAVTAAVEAGFMWNGRAANMNPIVLERLERA